MILWKGRNGACWQHFTFLLIYFGRRASPLYDTKLWWPRSLSSHRLKTAPEPIINLYQFPWMYRLHVWQSWHGWNSFFFSQSENVLKSSNFLILLSSAYNFLKTFDPLPYSSAEIPNSRQTLNPPPRFQRTETITANIDEELLWANKMSMVRTYRENEAICSWNIQRFNDEKIHTRAPPRC